MRASPVYWHLAFVSQNICPTIPACFGLVLLELGSFYGKYYPVRRKMIIVKPYSTYLYLYFLP